MSRFRTVGLNDSKSELSVCLSLESLTPPVSSPRASAQREGNTHDRSWLYDQT